MEQETKIRNNVFAFLLNVFCPGVVFLTDYFCTLTKSEKETGAYSSFSREKKLKTEPCIEKCMEDEFRVQGKNAKRLKEICEKEGLHSPAECADFLLNIYTKRNKDTNTLKEIRNRYENATCVQCQRQIKLGEICYWDPIEHKVLCSNCFIKNNANSFSSKEIVKLELKKTQLENELKVLQEEKKKLLNEMQIVQVYEELNNYPKKLEDLYQKIIKSIMDYGFSQDQGQKAKVLEEISQIKEVIKNQNQKLEVLARSLLKARARK